MSLNFDVVIESDDYSVDMTAGLETIQGASEITRIVTETILTENVPQRLSKNAKIRTKMKRSFEGSYGIKYSVELDDPDLKKRLRSIGKQTLHELIHYFVSESLYMESNKLSEKSEKTLLKLSSMEDKLVEQLRKSSLEHLLSMSKHFNKSVKLHYYKSATDKIEVASVNKNSCGVLVPQIDDTKITFEASITRLNINTGNGRLLIKGEDETVAFGFPSSYKEVKQFAKKKFSENLDKNNGIPSESWLTLTLQAKSVKLSNGRVIKYLIEKVL
ncbi:hypothetical protein C7R88_16975 (plasmid) [Plesiomonas shigelloides]|uniref:hypothetical protein n=1 Tax=Plesiomonas shigelloides TaxID=703 RepID=UPI000D130013|nr:hypothetical protein [Plesiomonas shigelloides]AVQ88999.1 hypothetical protein C7R88_16975 [Plesiomonas shigelloides]